MTDLPENSNRNLLAGETSPYLLQHAGNPVHWQPWGETAFARAAAEGKPVFLSVGYSTCHWCHVMEHESFEDNAVAALLNRDFICIKVDREERPDLDEIYMAATQILTRRGGWPNSVWLTPERRPWFAGTYFPKDMFINLLLQLSGAWREKRGEIETAAAQLTDAIRKMSAHKPDHTTARLPLDKSLLQRAAAAVTETFDPQNAGFGSAPKFPPHAALRLLQHEKLAPEPELADMCRRTLEAMRRGGIHDHLGGGFHRYATDADWLLPHFEKMLYDNAQLLRLYAVAAKSGGNPDFGETAIGIVNWLRRDMLAPNGGFYSAMDADSDGAEGRFYIWQEKEIHDLFGHAAADIFCSVYGIRDSGNFRDESSGRLTGANILHLSRTFAESATQFNISEPELRQRLQTNRQVLLDARSRRIPPFLDDKILAGWNGLLIESLAAAGILLDKPDWITLAAGAADFILDRFWQQERLCRSFRNGRTNGTACLDDCAFLGNGLLELHAVTGNDTYLHNAVRIARIICRHHHNHDSGGFSLAAADINDLISRPCLPYDNAVPCANAEAIRFLARLSFLTGDAEFSSAAGQALNAMLPYVRQAPAATCDLVMAAMIQIEHGVEALNEPARHEESILTIQAELSAATAEDAPQAKLLKAVFNIQLKPGWRVYATDAQNPKIFSLSLTEKQAARLCQVTYPEGSLLLEDGYSGASLYYTDTIRVEALVETGGAMLDTLIFELHFQACGNGICRPPEKMLIAVPLQSSRVTVHGGT